MDCFLIKTKDGSLTIHIPEMNEHYHSTNGAITESSHIFIKNGYLFYPENEKKVFEVGFGTGLNAFLTAIEANKNKIPTIYYTVDNHQLPLNIIDKLNYSQIIGDKFSKLFLDIHQAEWNNMVKITDFFYLSKIKLNIIKDKLPGNIKTGIVYFDAFGPDKQPEIWELPVLKKTVQILNEGGIFVTYSVKGIVRRRLASLGLQIEKIPGPPGKNQILRGIKK